MKIIVAKNKDDNISWINNFDDIVVYNVNNKTECHVYFHHIVSNYDNIDENNCFVQGNPTNLKNIDNIDFEFISGSTNYNPNKHSFDPDAYQKIFGDKCTVQKFVVGNDSQFIVSKRRIHIHAKSFYQNILEQLESTSATSANIINCIRKCWSLIFTDVYPQIPLGPFHDKNIPYTIEYKKIYNKCYRNNTGTDSKKEFDENAVRIIKLHSQQTLEQSLNLRSKWTMDDTKVYFGKMTVWDLFCKLALTVDKTDIALYNTNQFIHCIQTYVSMKENNETNKDLLIVALIHDIGKILTLLNEKDENVDCMTRILKFDKDLDSVITTFNHDEFGYFLMKKYVSRPIALAIRFHSCVGIASCNHQCLTDKDKNDLTLVNKLFEYDHNSKSTYWCPITVNLINECKQLIDEYFPDPLLF